MRMVMSMKDLMSKTIKKEKVFSDLLMDLFMRAILITIKEQERVDCFGLMVAPILVPSRMDNSMAKEFTLTVIVQNTKVLG